jgi:hypothetical protein
MTTPEAIAPTIEKAARLDPALPIEEYHQRTGWLSKSMLSVFADCPAKFKYQYIDGNRRQETQALRLGNAVHTFVLENAKFRERYHVMPEDVRRDARTKAYQEQLAEAAGRAILKPDDFETIKGMSAAMRNHKKVLALLDVPGKIEASIFWTDPVTGLKMRCRPDFLRDDGLIVDLKTAASAAPKDFMRSAYDLNYDISVALTAAGYRALTGSEPAEYVFIVQEKEPPYVVEAYNTFSPFADGVTYADVGEYRLRKLIEAYRHCLKNNRWPGYSDKIEILGVPHYELKNLDMQNEGETANG